MKRRRRIPFSTGELILIVLCVFSGIGLCLTGLSLFHVFDKTEDRTILDATTEAQTEPMTEPPAEPEPLTPEEQLKAIWADDPRTPVEAKGIYITGPVAGTVNTLNELIELVDTTELNAVVIDVKNDSGEITYEMEQETVQAIGAVTRYVSDMEGLVNRLHEKGIYVIARVVAFKDPILAEQRPEYSLKNADGSIFRDKDGLAWVNPYRQEVWHYLVEVSKEAVSIGFDKYACEQLVPLGAYVSADVYGTIINNPADGEIVGQNYQAMAQYLDYICPMIYPSHYNDGVYGIAHPDMDPYNLILNAVRDSEALLAEQGQAGHTAKSRAWLQDFTAAWLANYISYGPEQIRAQINGVYDAGASEWFLWSGSNRYTAGGLLGLSN